MIDTQHCKSCEVTWKDDALSDCWVCGQQGIWEPTPSKLPRALILSQD